MDAATATHVIAQVERLLGAETIYQNRKVRRAMNMRLQELALSRIRAGDRPTMATPLPPVEMMPARIEERTMSVTGIQAGAFQAKLAEMRQKIADRQNEALGKIDGAVTSGAAKMNAAVDDVISKADKEVDAALHEFAQFTNGPQE